MRANLAKGVMCNSKERKDVSKILNVFTMNVIYLKTTINKKVN